MAETAVTLHLVHSLQQVAVAAAVDMDKLDNRVLVVHLAAVADKLHTQLQAVAVALAVLENMEDV